jgi:hypothetical protein
VTRAALAAILSLLLVPAAASAGISGFKTPKRSISCAYIAFDDVRTLRCDITGMTNAPTPKPKSCDFDWGSYFGMDPTGRSRRLCVSDTPQDPRFPTLAYGRTWKRGGFTCRSRTTGVRCTNRSGHGFVISRAKQTLF